MEAFVFLTGISKVKIHDLTMVKLYVHCLEHPKLWPALTSIQPVLYCVGLFSSYYEKEGTVVFVVYYTH